MSTVLLTRGVLGRGNAARSFTENQPESITFTRSNVWSVVSPRPSGWFVDGPTSTREPDAVTLAGVPEGTTAYRTQWFSGDVTGEAGAISFDDNPAGGCSELYHAWSQRLSDGFVEYPSGTKVIYPSKTGGAGKGWVLNMIVNGDLSAGTYTWYLLQIPNQTLAPSGAVYCNASGYTQASPYPCTDTTWYKNELWVKKNSGAGVADGAIKMWVAEWNGTTWNAPVLIMDYPAIETGATSWTGPLWDIFRGGSGGTPLSADQQLYINRTVGGYATP